MKSEPIGIFDSGVGGISVLRELIKIMPHEDYIYFGDSANAPYGSKSLKKVRELSLDIAKQLMQKDVKAIIVACNTATSASVKKLRELYEDIVIVGIEPAVKPAVESNPGSVILVLATPVTLKEEKYHKLVNQFEEQAEIISVPCSQLAEMIEKGESKIRIKEYMSEVLKPYTEMKPRAVVLGCTHYPFVSDVISDILGKDVSLFDGGAGVAKEVKRRLDEKNVLNTDGGKITFLSSGDVEALKEFAAKYI